jgi:hypothetical protein
VWALVQVHLRRGVLNVPHCVVPASPVHYNRFADKQTRVVVRHLDRT